MIMDDLLNHLRGQRAYLINKMSNAHQRGSAIRKWPLPTRAIGWGKLPRGKLLNSEPIEPSTLS